MFKFLLRQQKPETKSTYLLDTVKPSDFDMDRLFLLLISHHSDIEIFVYGILRTIIECGHDEWCGFYKNTNTLLKSVEMEMFDFFIREGMFLEEEGKYFITEKFLENFSQYIK